MLRCGAIHGGQRRGRPDCTGLRVAIAGIHVQAPLAEQRRQNLWPPESQFHGKSATVTPYCAQKFRKAHRAPAHRAGQLGPARRAVTPAGSDHRDGTLRREPGLALAKAE